MLTIDSSVMPPREEFMHSLCEIIGVQHVEITELDTPPYTPDSPNNVDGGVQPVINGQMVQTSKIALNEEMKVEMTTTPEQQGMEQEKIICKNCNTFIPADKTPIVVNNGKLDPSETVTFFSSNCI